MLEMSLSPFERYTFFNTVSFGFFMYSQIYGAEQINLQRICAVKSIKNARSYAGCDPMALGIIKRNAEIIPYFVINKSFIPGLSGIFIAAIIGGSL
ncbi:putative sodium-dependent multivitamin transporter, partial [Armadillidium vulgare]